MPILPSGRYGKRSKPVHSAKAPVREERNETIWANQKAIAALFDVIRDYTYAHSFVDGNKRIAATLFLWFMQNNGILYRPDGSKRISDASLVARKQLIINTYYSLHREMKNETL